MWKIIFKIRPTLVGTLNETAYKEYRRKKKRVDYNLCTEIHRKQYFKIEVFI